jgi:hypothetical protein
VHLNHNHNHQPNQVYSSSHQWPHLKAACLEATRKHQQVGYSGLSRPNLLLKVVYLVNSLKLLKAFLALNQSHRLMFLVRLSLSLANLNPNSPLVVFSPNNSNFLLLKNGVNNNHSSLKPHYPL